MEKLYLEPLVKVVQPKSYLTYCSEIIDTFVNYIGSYFY